MSYRKQLEELILSLEQREGITIKAAEMNMPASRAAIETARTYGAYRLPKGVEEFYREMNGFRLEWVYEGVAGETEYRDQGSINLIPVERIFGSWKDVVWFEGIEGGDRFKEVKPFDLFQDEACMAFCQKPEAAPTDEVHFHYFGEAICPTGFTFPEYLDRLIASKGYFGWQMSLSPQTRQNPEVEMFKMRMKYLFPDFHEELF